MADSRRPHEPSSSSRQHDMGSSYRPARSDRHPPPLADRMTFTSGGGSSYRPDPPGRSQSQRQHGAANRQSEFTFESNHTGTLFPPTGPANAGPPARRNRAPPRGANDHSRRGDYADSSHSRRIARGRNHANGFHTGAYRKPAPHQRALLQQRDDGSPEHTMGVSDGPSRFLNPDDLSDDEEAEMDVESDSSTHDDTATGGRAGNYKVARTTNSRADGDSVPKWSNPDPYTVAPPPDETTGKKTDFVKLIRKAKNQAAEKAAGHNSVAANDDFISFGEDDNDNGREAQILHNGAPVHRQNIVHIIEDDEPIPSPRQTNAHAEQRGAMNDIEYIKSAVVAPRGGVPPFEAARPDNRSHPPFRGKKRKFDSGISIVDDWIAVPSSNPTPWLLSTTAYEHLATEPDKWLHNEIIDFYDFVAPHPFEETARDDLVRRVNNALGAHRFPREPGRILCFGSFPAGLYLPTADMDLVYTSDRHYNGGPPVLDFSRKGAHKALLHKAAHRLTDARLSNSKPFVIATAKVPIIKFQDRITRLQVDISFENLSGVLAQACFRAWKEEFPDMIYMVALMKQFLVMRGLNEVHTGGIGGFSIICLIVSYLQHTGKPDNLGGFFLGFLDYYGNKFDISRKRIVMFPPAVVGKTAVGIDGRAEKLDGLSIQDPNRPENNISGGSHKAKAAFEAFAEAHATLQDRMRLAGAGQYNRSSILECVLGGNYESYLTQRNHLKSLYARGEFNHPEQLDRYITDARLCYDEWTQLLGEMLQLQTHEYLV